MVRPDRPLGAGDLVAQVHAAAERPADLELAHRAALEADQRDRVVLGLDRMDERVGPAHHLDGPVLLAHVGADDLDAVAAEVDDRPAARLRRVPEPGAVRAGMRLARARPEDVADLARLHGRDRLQRLRRVDEILEVAAEDAGALDRVEHPLRLLGRARERLRAEHRLAVLRAELDRLLVQLVRQPDHDRVRLGMRDRLPRGRSSTPGTSLSRAERLRPLLGARVDDVDAVAVALPVQRSRVEETDETRAEHAHPVADHRAASSSFDDDVSTEPTRYLAAAKDLLERLESQSAAVAEVAAALRRRDRGRRSRPPLRHRATRGSRSRRCSRATARTRASTRSSSSR